MPLDALLVPNLINGVSQQADELRFPSQLKEQINYTSDPIKGLSRRNPAEYAGTLITNDSTNYFFHDIQRDATEKYLLTVKNITGGSNCSIYVHDLEGNQQTIKDAGGTALVADAAPSYLDTATPMESLKAITVADYTYILNKDITPALEAATTSTRNPEAILMVKQTRYDTEYTIKIWNDATSTSGADHSATFTTLSTLAAAPTAQLESQGTIMSNLVSGLSSPSGYTLVQSGALLHIQRDISTDFRIEVTCDAPESLFAFKDTVQDVSLLPKEGYNGFEIQVIGSPDDEGDEYYIKFQTPENASVGFSSGSWVETRAQGIQYQIDQDTMPMILISNGADFTLKAADWGERLVGDDDSNPAPSFIGNPINSISFYKNRLRLLADENRIESQSGEYFNFWRTTVTFLKDEDVIDNSNPHTKVSILHHDVPIGGKDNEFVTLWSDKTIFIDSATGLRTPATTSISPSDEVEVSTQATPVALNKKIYFAYSTGAYSGVSEYAQDREMQEYQSDRISEQIPNYIDGDVKLITGSSRLDMLAVVTTEAPSKNFIYVYKFLEKQGEKLQAAWYKFFLGNGDEDTVFGGMLIEYVFFVDTKLYIVSTLGGSLVISYIDMDTAYTDTDAAVTTHLDMKIDESQLTSRTYNIVTDETEIVVPYDFPAGAVIGLGTRLDSIYSTDTHIEIPVQSTDPGNKKFWVKGDHTTTKLWIGYKYLPKATLTRPTMRNKSTGANLPVASGKFYVRRGNILYDNSRKFNVTVSVDYRDPDVNTFKDTAINVGNGGISQSPSESDGNFPFGVYANAREVEVAITTPGIFSSNFILLEWEGKYRRASRFR